MQDKISPILQQIRRNIPALLLVVISIAYIAYKAFYIAPVSTDVRYLWVAGKVWGSGNSPYLPLYGVTGKVAFSGEHFEPLWVYPPNWYPFSRALAYLPYSVASRLWSVFTIALISITSLILYKACTNKIIRYNVFFAAILLFISLISNPTIMTVIYGQTSAILYFGCGLLLMGLLKGSRLWIAFGVFLVMLKPNIGIPFCAMACLVNRGFFGVVLGGLLTIAAAFPAFLIDGPINTASHILENLEVYGTYPINMPSHLPGLFHLVDKMGLPTPSIFTALFLTFVPIFSAFLIFRFKQADTHQSTLCIFVVTTASVTLLMMPHQYDLVIAYSLFPLAMRFRWKEAILCCALPIVSIRISNIDYLSAASLVTFTGALLAALNQAGHLPQAPMEPGAKPIAPMLPNP